MKLKLLFGLFLVFLFSLSAIEVDAWGTQFHHGIIAEDVNNDGQIKSWGGNEYFDYKGDLHIEGRWEKLAYKYETSKGDPYTVDDITNYVTRTSTDQGRYTHVLFETECEQNGTFYHQAVELSYNQPNNSTNAVLFSYKVDHSIIGGTEPRAWFYIEKSDPKILVGFFNDAVAYSMHAGNVKTWTAGKYRY